MASGSSFIAGGRYSVMPIQNRCLLAQPNSVTGWVQLIAQSTLPVLPKTREVIDCFRARREACDVHEIARDLPRDPFFTAKLFAYLARARGELAAADVGTIGRAILMLGIDRFFAAFDNVPVISRDLFEDRHAHRGLIRVMRRARRAARFAHAMAVWRNDPATEEIMVAALLHDIAEMLVWLLAPQAALKMRDLQGADSTLRSRAAQRQVLGFELDELLAALAIRWHLPHQIVVMMEGQIASGQRGRIMTLAVNLARHSATGWNNAALPDDFHALAELLMVSPDQARKLVAAPPLP
jgi:HD-like signal output (HDOD) protein